MTDNNKKVGETSSGEVVNGFRSCRDLSDIVPLYTARSLYLKPVAKINVSVNLPQLKTPGKNFSWNRSFITILFCILFLKGPFLGFDIFSVQ